MNWRCFSILYVFFQGCLRPRKRHAIYIRAFSIFVFLLHLILLSIEKIEFATPRKTMTGRMPPWSSRGQYREPQSPRGNSGHHISASSSPTRAMGTSGAVTLRGGTQDEALQLEWLLPHSDAPPAGSRRPLARTSLGLVTARRRKMSPSLLGASR